MERPPVSPVAITVKDGVTLDCLPIAGIRETRVRDDWTIDFLGGNGEVWRNTLPRRCAGMRAAGAIAYETSISQLCHTDQVHVLRQIGGRLQRGVGCGLGHFVPVRLEP